ncbi:ribonuclease 3-like protein 2 isoform X2 [Rhododendron vialii]|uniref:ribonuclease 3-like protein 2 isoform X2 n=1 Tax=Rhododendron vialii TaxID=182163 RepID=UPI00265E796F|nr:ribonuclease 3-like protein 2 isoform X2 [Rhododendron vialii]
MSCVALDLWFLGSKIHKRIIENNTPGPGDADDEDYGTDISDSVRAVEKLLDYSFKGKRLLEEALTHSSCTDSASYQRLEWLGDSALGLAVSNFLFSAHPDLQPGQLSLLRSANTSTEKLARAAVRCRLHCYFRHDATALDGQVREFALAVQKEDDTVVHEGVVKAPKVLADIVESVAGAVYVDCKLDLHVFWAIFRRLLEPIVDPETLWKQPHPVTLLHELCQKDGRKVDFKFREEEKDNAVYVDGELIASASSEIQAARAALKKLCLYECNCKMDVDYSCIYGTTEIEGAKEKLHTICGKKRWPKPYYGNVKESGPFHERIYVRSVEIKTAENVLYNLCVEGDEKSRVRDADNSAASLMIRRLQALKKI